MSGSRGVPTGPREGRLLSARLALPDGELSVHPGEVVRLPDDPRHVERLLGRARDRRDEVVLAGRRLGRRAEPARVRAGLVSVGGGQVAPDVTVEEHLVAVCGRSRAADRLAAAPLLAGRGHELAGVLSGGERRILDWLVADALRPRVAVLDRPGTGLDPVSLAWAHELLDRWLAAGVGVLLRTGRSEEEGWFDRRADGIPRP